jgi:hypothetical protein
MLMGGADSVRPSVTAEGRNGRTDREGRRGPVALGAPRRMNGDTGHMHGMAVAGKNVLFS